MIPRCALGLARFTVSRLNERAGGAGAAGRSGDALAVEQEQQRLALEALEAEVHRQILVGHESYRSNGFRERPSGEDKRQRRVPDEYEFLKEYSIYIKKSREKIHEWGFFLLFL